jgi:hypothetical protein
VSDRRTPRHQTGAAFLLALGLAALPTTACATGASDGGFAGSPGSHADSGAPAPGSVGAPIDSGSTTGEPVVTPDSAAPPASTDDSGPVVVDSSTAPASPLDASVMEAAALDSTVGDAAAEPDSAVAGDASSTGLDPLLDPPSATGAPCATPGSEAQCPSLQVCRIDSSSGGRCEGCTSCNNLGKACSQSSDCDILFQCYAGVCANICPLGTQYCGAVTDCLDVGNAAYGVCRPQ